MLDLDVILESDGLLQTSFDDYLTLTYRLLTLKEYRIFRGLRDGGVLPPFVLADKVFERCYIGNVGALSEHMPAGVMVTIGNLIMYLSGDCEIDTLKQDINMARRYYPEDSVQEHMKVVICTAFPYKYEEVEAWTRRELIQRFIISEAVLAKRNPDFQRLDLKDMKTQEELAAEKTTGANIDFRKENAMIGKAMGPFNEEEARSTSLNPQQLKRLKERVQSR